MNYLAWYINFLVKHPFIVLLAISVFSCICLTLPYIVNTMRFPNFQDPQKGFSTRGTPISNTLTSWRNLVKESSGTSGLLIKNAKEYLKQTGRLNATLSNEPHVKRVGERKKNKRRKHKFGNNNEIEDYHKNETVYGKVITIEKNTTDSPELTNRWQYLQNFTEYILAHKRPTYEKQFCGPPDEKYIHLVIIAKDKREDLFTWTNLQRMCKLENILMNLESVPDLCISNTQETGKCCKPWSLPNYIASLFERNNCLKITENDVNKTKAVLQKCAPYFHRNELYPSCFRKKNCKVPLECLKHDAVFNILNYLTSISFMPSKDSTSVSHVLEESIIFLPIAASIASLPLYYEIEKINNEIDNLSIVAMDLGIKSIIFDEYLQRDLWLMALGAIFIFFCVRVYTSSTFLTAMTIMAIVSAMGITYFLYIVVYEIAFFPFINLLTVVICIGIGADDAFIFCKIWHVNKNDTSNDDNISKIMSETFRHAFKSMFVTSLTTAVAFWGSYVSSVTAISCFSIFAGTAIVINFFLMMTLFPACLVIWEQSALLQCTCPCHFILTQLFSWFRTKWNWSGICYICLSSLWNRKKEYVINAVIKFKYVWIGVFVALTAAGTVIVFFYPKLKLPSSTDFQLFSSNHPFEKYDFIYKDKFWFRKEKSENMDEYKLPLRFVWGVLPVDNGDHLNPADFGHLELDPQFNMADPTSQVWLRDFCTNIKDQPFFLPISGISLTSCFIETFVESMDTSCIEDFFGKNVTPCCNISSFPFEPTIFDICIIEEMNGIYAGPTDLTYPKTAGVMFSKDESPTVKAVVIEFNSNYSFSMSYENSNEFYMTVTEWFKKELETAPSIMKNGFFVSDLEFYDVQFELSRGTRIAIFASMALASTVLFVSTLNPLISTLAIVTITFSIITTIATLVLCGWTLNVLESIAVSTAIGLDVDFTLHYCINYRMCPTDRALNREDSTRYALSCIMGPSFMAGLTTAAAGFFMMFSVILPYYQIGLFLVLLMTVSWIHATFFLGALLATLGPTQDACQYTFTGLLHKFFGNRNEPVRDTNDAIAGTSSSQDLDRVSFIKHDTPIPVKRKSFKEPQVRYTPSQGLTDQSPSSNITIIMADDN